MVKNQSKYRFNNFFLFGFILLRLIFIFFFLPHALAATQASFEWDPNSELDLAGYRLFCREKDQSFNYANPCWEGIVNYCTIYNLDENKSYCFVAKALNTEGYESENSNEVCQEPSAVPNQAPTADAGPDQTVNEGQSVLLNGSNSTDPDDGIASYHWIQLGGHEVNLSDPFLRQTTFTAPDVGPEGAALTFELAVVDHSGLKHTDSCIVNITWLNEPPLSDAGPDQTVAEGVVVTLNGSSSIDIDNGISSYLWTQNSGPEVILSNPTLSQPTFIAPNVGPDGTSLTFILTVSDAGGLQDTDSCIVNISWQNEPPFAVVTPIYIDTKEGFLVTLNGSASKDSDDGIASYLWSQIEGDPVTLSDPTSAVTTFTAPEAGPFNKNINFKLTVKDYGGLKDEAEAFVYIMQEQLMNNSPAADFSFAISNKVVKFIDNSYDSDGIIVSWFWDFGDGETSTEQNPKHRYVKFKDYSITLSVTDDVGASNVTMKNLAITK